MVLDGVGLCLGYRELGEGIVMGNLDGSVRTPFSRPGRCIMENLWTRFPRRAAGAGDRVEAVGGVWRGVVTEVRQKRRVGRELDDFVRVCHEPLGLAVQPRSSALTWSSVRRLASYDRDVNEQWVRRIA